MKLGIVGVSGLVGQKIIESLDIIERFFDCSKSSIYLYGSVDTNINVQIFGVNHKVSKFENEYLHHLDYCILAVDNLTAKNIIGFAKTEKTNCVIIDNSSEFRMDIDVPVIIPEINMDDYYGQKIIANPNCSTIILLMALYPLTLLGNIKRVVVSTYQAASGAGKKGLEELETQTSEYANGVNLTTTFWKKQYIHNLFSHNSNVDNTTLYNEEELKIINETKKILHNENIVIDPTCVRVPVLQSHCISFNVEFENDIEMKNVIDSLTNFPGIIIENNIEHNEFPEPVKSTNTRSIFVGRIRHHPKNCKIWSFFVSGDQLLKGAAYNSVQILEKILMKKIL